MTASESRESAPVGVLSSWLTLATKSRRTASIRRASVRSSTRSSTSREPSGATRAETARASPRPVPRRARSSSTCRISPSRRVSRAMLSMGSTASLPPRTRPSAYAAELAFTTESLSSRTTAEERSTDSTVSTPGGSTASVCREVRVGRAWSRSLQRNASMAITPVHTPAIAANAATAAFTSMAPRLCGVTDTLPAVRVAPRTVVAQSSPWRRGWFICPGGPGGACRPEFTWGKVPVHIRGWNRTHRGPNVGAWGSEAPPGPRSFA